MNNTTLCLVTKSSVVYKTAKTYKVDQTKSSVVYKTVKTYTVGQTKSSVVNKTVKTLLTVL
jgi:hypothetical protein